MAKTLQSAVFLPLSAQTSDPETIAWCRGVPLAIAEELQRLGMARASFAAWTTGRGLGLRLAHLQSAPPVGHVAAYARAARARIGISGWGSWQGDPILRWEVVDADGSEARPVPVDTRPGASRLEVVRMAWETAKLVLGLMDDRPAPVLEGTDSDAALLAWVQDRQQVWYRRRRGVTGAWDGEYRFLLSALTHDPAFEPASRAVIRRAGQALHSGADPASTTAARTRAIDALTALLRVRSDDHLCWTLLGMHQRAGNRGEEAILALRRAAAIDGAYAPAHRELGMLFLGRSDLRAAGAHLRQAGKLAPEDPEVQFGLGSLYLELKDRTRAAQHLKVVMRLASGSELAKAASRLLRDMDDGPIRRPTDALVEQARTSEADRERDRDLIARTFGLPTLDFDDEDDMTSPGDDFLERLDGEETELDPDETVWSEE